MNEWGREATTDDTFITSYDKSLQLHRFLPCLLMVCDVQVVEGSSKVNEAQLVGTQSGDVLVKLYDWTGRLLQLHAAPQTSSSRTASSSLLSTMVNYWLHHYARLSLVYQQDVISCRALHIWYTDQSTGLKYCLLTKTTGCYIVVWHTNVAGTVRVQKFVGEEAHIIIILKDVDLLASPVNAASICTKKSASSVNYLP